MKYDNEFIQSPPCPVPYVKEDGSVGMKPHPKYIESELPLEGELCNPLRRKFRAKARDLGVTPKRLKKLVKRWRRLLEDIDDASCN